MKRAHRTWQRRAWWLLATAVAVLITGAWLSRHDVGINMEWPAWLAVPATQAGG